MIQCLEMTNEQSLSLIQINENKSTKNNFLLSENLTVLKIKCFMLKLSQTGKVKKKQIIFKSMGDLGKV